MRPILWKRWFDKYAGGPSRQSGPLLTDADTLGRHSKLELFSQSTWASLADLPWFCGPYMCYNSTGPSCVDALAPEPESARPARVRSCGADGMSRSSYSEIAYRYCPCRLLPIGGCIARLLLPIAFGVNGAGYRMIMSWQELRMQASAVRGKGLGSLNPTPLLPRTRAYTDAESSPRYAAITALLGLELKPPIHRCRPVTDVSPALVRMTT